MLRRKEEGVRNNAVFRPLYLVHLGCLLGNGHILVDNAQATFPRHGYSHAGIGNRVHGGGHQGNIQFNFVRKLCRQVNILGQHFAAMGYQQYVVKGKTFPNNLLKHGRPPPQPFVLKLGLSAILSNSTWKVNAVFGQIRPVSGTFGIFRPVAPGGKCMYNEGIP